MAKVIVIGAGISGLSTAYWIQKAGHDVVLLEKESRAGGSIDTLQEEGYLFEKGPNSFLDNVQETLDLCLDLGLENELLTRVMRGAKRYLFLNGRLQEAPSGPGALYKTELLSARSKRRLLTEVFRGGNRSPEDESLASFIRRRFGDEMLHNMVTPFVSGVYAGDPEKLSLRATFPMLYDLERESGSLVRGMIRRGLSRKKKSDQPKKRRTKNLCSFVDGMSALVRALTGELKEALHLGVNVNPIEKRSGGGFSVSAEGMDAGQTADAVVLAAPSHVVPAIAGSLLAETSEYLQSIPYNRLNVVGIGYQREDIESDCDGFGFLVPRDQEIRILGSIWSSSLFARRAPGGMRCFTVFVGGALDPNAILLSDEELLELVQNDLNVSMGIKGKPVIQRIFRWEKAIPQYPVGHVENIERVNQERERTPGFFLTGNYLDGVSVNDCIRNAKQTAKSVCEYLNITMAARGTGS